MSTKLMRRNAAVVAVFALCCVFGAKARAVDVSPATIAAELSTWTAGDLPLKLAPGVYDLTTVAAPQLAATGMPGNLTIQPADAVDSLAPIESITLNLRFPLKPNGHSVFISRMKLAGTIDTLATPLAIVSLERVWLDGGVGPTGILVRPNCSLVMSACAVTGGNVQINCGGAASIERCTFREGIFNFPSTVQPVVLNANIFEVLPVLSASATGSMNFIRGGGAIQESTNANFALDVGQVLGNEPRYLGTSGATAWGKLEFSLQPLEALNVTAIASLPDFDFEGQGIDEADKEIGADEVNREFPTPEWISCKITGPVGATLYVNDSVETIPIVHAGVPLEIDIVAKVPGITASEVVKLLVYSEYELTLPEANRNPVEVPLTIDTPDVDGRFTATGTYISSSGDDWNGYAEVRLAVGVNEDEITRYALGNSDDTRQILIDTVPPNLPDFINSSLSPGALGCGDWLLDTSGVPVGGRPHLMYKSYPALSVDFTLPLADELPLWSDGNRSVNDPAGFEAPRLQDDPRVVDWPRVDAVFGNNSTTAPKGYSGLGTAVWTNAAFDGAPALQQPIGKTVSSSGLGTTSSVQWRIQFNGPSTLFPNVVKWDAEIVITDRAGNETVIPTDFSPRFWWMPPGSTFASVGEDTDALNPQFSWSLGMTPGSNASNLDLPSDSCITQAELLTCFATTPTDPNFSGWDSGGIGWTDPTTVRSVDSNTRMGANGEFSLGELFAANLGLPAAVMVRVTDPAGNPQEILGMGPGSLTATTSNVSQMANDFDEIAGIYLIPARVAEGALDTIASARFFLNRTDRSDESRLWSIDPDETTFGVGPNVPLTPIDACGQRLEAEITVDVSVPDNLPGEVDASQVDVEFEVYEEGRFVAAGTLSRRGNDPSAPMKLFIPADLLEGRGNPTTAAGNSRSDPATGVLVEQESTDFPDPAAFLNFPPPPCESSSNLHISNNPDQYGDRLGDDGDPASRDLITGDVVKPYRTRAVAYTVVLRARSGTLASGTTDAARFDTTPATIHFYVKPDTTTDSGVPPIKSNKKL